MSDLIVRYQGPGDEEPKDYPLPVDDVLEDLTGTESAMLEDYLGGWGNFSVDASTRSAVVTIWLALRHNGQTRSIEAIEQTKGLLFGDALDIAEVDAANPPEQAADAAEPSSSPETSETSGLPPSPSDTA